jgi:hypothetical protein
MGCGHVHANGLAMVPEEGSKDEKLEDVKMSMFKI